MSVRVRLTRVGNRKNPMWRVVVADQRSPRDGRVIESIGHYNAQTEPSTIVIDRDRLDHWLERGARPTNTVRKLMRAENTQPAAGAVATEPPVDAEPAAAEPATEAATEAEGAVEPEPEAAAEAETEPPLEAESAPAEATDEPVDSSDAPAG